jgi:hypothetical protein
VCPPDDNVCTREYCSGGSCRSEPVTNGRSCTYDGLSGVCVEGVCGENLCEDVVCDDDVCTEGTCDYVDGTCDFTAIVCDDYEKCTEDTCDPMDGCVFTAVEDGTECGGPYGMCEAGSCVAPCDLASDEEYQCPIKDLENLFCCPGSEYCRDDCFVPECQTPEDCDDDDVCTDDRCDYVHGTCDFKPVVCDDDNPCTQDTCDPVNGCTFTPFEDCCREDCWVAQTSGTTNDLSDVSFTDASTGTVAGRFGTILRTTDGGVTWVAQESGTSEWLGGVSFTDANIGTVVGQVGTILRTTDGGATWVSQDAPPGTDQFFDVSFTDANTGTIVGAHHILRTRDGGATWWVQLHREWMGLRGVSFIDTSTGTAVGDDGLILRRTDGGGG